MSKIKGYRELDQEEIDLMNEGKELADKCRTFIDKLENNIHIDKRCCAIGKTNLQQGFMWITSSIAKPKNF